MQRAPLVLVDNLLGVLRDCSHGGDRLRGEGAVGGLARQHNCVGAINHRICDTTQQRHMVSLLHVRCCFRLQHRNKPGVGVLVIKGDVRASLYQKLKPGSKSWCKIACVLDTSSTMA